MARGDQGVAGRVAVVVVLVVATVTVLPRPVAAADPATEQVVPLELRHLVDVPDTPNGTRARLIAMASTGDRLFVVEQSNGRLYEIVDRDSDPGVELWFDVGAAVEAVTDRRLDRTNAAHGGLRSVAFHPDFASNGLFYVSLMESRPADPRGHTYLSDVADPVAADGVLLEFRASTEPRLGSAAAVEVVDPSTYREVFRVGMAVYDHPIKQIGFDPFVGPTDPDHGLLYVAHGDGSEGSATAGGGLGNDALGKILRVDPTAAGSGSGPPAPYTVPATNPFSGSSQAMLDAVYSLGHRNPHSLAFARQGTETLLISAEAGRDNVEEVNLITPGANYGWSDREGTFVHLPGGGVDTGVAPLPLDEWRRGLTYPAAQYRHAGPGGATVTGESIVGGFAVDNGSALSGRYLAADFPISGLIFQVRVAALVAARQTLATGQAPSALSPATLTPTPVLLDHDGDPSTDRLLFENLAGVLARSPRWEGQRADVRFGQGPDGELYVTSKRTGEVYLVTNSLPVGTGSASSSALSPAQSAGLATMPTTVAEALSLDDLVAAVDYRDDDGQVLRLYHAFFARQPDLAGARYWIDRSRAGIDLADLAWGFAASEEFDRRYGAVDDATFLDIVYHNVLGRESDEPGRRYWLDLLERGELDRHEVVRWVAAGAEFVRRYPYTPALQR